MTDYEYDENLPYVVEQDGRVIARFEDFVRAEWAADFFETKIIDTTPKPRVPDDAYHITYRDDAGGRWYAEREGDLWRADDSMVYRTHTLTTGRRPASLTMPNSGPTRSRRERSDDTP